MQKRRSSRVGIYLWGGPGTIRLLKTKYHSPRIDEKSFLSLYDESYLAKAKQIFRLTDAWITYSWGFSDAKEQEDYTFLREKLQNFKTLGIRTHAYVQGLNVVTKDFESEDIFCLDPKGKKLSYSRGRSFICPNNPQAQEFILSRVRLACMESVGGIYVDNMIFGMPPLIVYKDFIPFFGCACRYCQQKFKKMFGYPLPLWEKSDQSIHDFLQFRAQSMTELITNIASVVHASKREFGINLYDPTLRNDTLYYGYSFERIRDVLDYYLLENHTFPINDVAANTHALPLIQSTSKPTFIVSYKHDIGREKNFTQDDINAVFSESDFLGYAPCIKGTEFTTQGIWHPLYLDTLSRPQRNISLKKGTTIPSKIPKTIQPHTLFILTCLQPFFTTLLFLIAEVRYIAAIVRRTGIAEKEIQEYRLWNLSNDQ